MWIRGLSCVVVASLIAVGASDRRAGSLCRAAGPDKSAAASGGKPKIERISKSDVEWRKLLTKKQFEVTRRGDTEPAFANKYWRYKRAGRYLCVCCGLELFDSRSKFDSHTGWPSFWQPVDDEHVALAPDVSEAPPKMEVTCARCDAHLGHVFGDGPPPTGLRFCMNSAALRFVDAKTSAGSKHAQAAHDEPSR
jgi:peptide-methionine (R)-S-oxide reductase